MNSARGYYQPEKNLFWIFPTFLKLFDGEDCDSLWRERGGLTNQVDKGDKVAKEGAGKSESPDHKPVMKASNNLQCQCCCRHLMLYPETEMEFSVKWTTSCSSSCQSRWASQSRSLRLVAARERTMSNSRNSFQSKVFGEWDICQRRYLAREMFGKGDTFLMREIFAKQDIWRVRYLPREIFGEGDIFRKYWPVLLVSGGGWSWVRRRRGGRRGGWGRRSRGRDRGWRAGRGWQSWILNKVDFFSSVRSSLRYVGPL